MRMSERVEALEDIATRNILVVENDESIGELLVLTIKQETPFKVYLAVNAVEALRIAQQSTLHLFLIDYHLSTITGIQLYDELHGIRGLEQVPAILMSASLELYERELKSRNLGGISKPFDLDEFIRTIEKALT
jgi:DNA-binding NtrC family response regulator